MSNVKWCFEPHALPRCKSFLITEANVYRVLTASQFIEQTSTEPIPHGVLRDHINWSLGGMVNRSQDAALGAAVTLAWGGERFGAEARARRWLSDRGAIDVSAGPLLSQVYAHSPSAKTLGFGAGADVSLMWSDWIGLTARGEWIQVDGRTVHAVYAGARLGSFPAIALTAGVGLLYRFVMGIEG